MSRHIIHCGFHTALKSSWINEVPDLDTKVPLVYRIGQERAMGDAFSRAKRTHEWMRLQQLAKKMKRSDVGLNNGEN